MNLTRQQVEALARKVAPTVIQKVGGGVDTNKLVALAVGVSAVETGGTFNPESDNDNSSARGIMQVLICTQRAIEADYGYGFAPASYKPPSSCQVKNIPRDTVPKPRDRMYSPEYAMTIGMTNLAYQLKRYNNNERLALVAYNQGNASQPAQKRGRYYLNAFVDKNPEHPLSQQMAKEGIGNNEPSIAATQKPKSTKPIPTTTGNTLAATTSTAPKKKSKVADFFRNAAVALFMKTQLRPRSMSPTPITLADNRLLPAPSGCGCTQK